MLTRAEVYAVCYSVCIFQTSLMHCKNKLFYVFLENLMSKFLVMYARDTDFSGAQKMCVIELGTSGSSVRCTTQPVHIRYTFKVCLISNIASDFCHHGQLLIL